MSERKLRKALEEIVAVASGERQVAVDDTEGMEWIDKRARKALAEAALRAETPPAPIRELFEQAPGKRNLNYLDDLRHDLHDEEFRYQYLSACAMDGGDSLRIGMRDVLAALAQQARAETPAPCELQTLITRAKEFRHSVDEKGKFISDLDATAHLCDAVDVYEAAGDPEQAK